VKFGLDFRYHSSSGRPRFETKQPIGIKVSRLVRGDGSTLFLRVDSTKLHQIRDGRSLEVRFPLKHIAKSSITQPEIVRFFSNLPNLVSSLTMWHLIYCKLQGQGVKGQGHGVT